MGYGSRLRKITIQRGSRAGGTNNTASLTLQDIVFTATGKGSSHNAKTVTVVAGGPLSRALSVSVVSNAITITPATNGSGTITTTTAQAVTAVNANGSAAALVTASGGSVTVIAAVAATALTGGTDFAIGG